MKGDEGANAIRSGWPLASLARPCIIGDRGAKGQGRMKIGGARPAFWRARRRASRARAAWAPDLARAALGARSPGRSRSAGFFCGSRSRRSAASASIWRPIASRFCGCRRCSRCCSARSLSPRAAGAWLSRCCVGACALCAGFLVDGPAHRARRRARARPYPHRQAARLRRGDRHPPRRRAAHPARRGSPATCPRAWRRAGCASRRARRPTSRRAIMSR